MTLQGILEGWSRARACIADMPPWRRKIVVASLMGLPIAVLLTLHSLGHRRPPPPPPPPHAMPAKLVRIDPAALALENLEGWTKDVKTDDKVTTYRAGPRRLQRSDLKVGQIVAVKDHRLPDGTWLALDVDVLPPPKDGPPPPPPGDRPPPPGERPHPRGEHLLGAGVPSVPPGDGAAPSPGARTHGLEFLLGLLVVAGALRFAWKHVRH